MITWFYAWIFKLAVRRFVHAQKNACWAYLPFGNFLLGRYRVTATYGLELSALGIKRSRITSKRFTYGKMLDVLQQMTDRYSFEAVCVLNKDDDPVLQAALTDRGYQKAIFLDKAYYRRTGA